MPRAPVACNPKQSAAGAARVRLDGRAGNLPQSRRFHNLAVSPAIATLEDDALARRLIVANSYVSA